MIEQKLLYSKEAIESVKREYKEPYKRKNEVPLYGDDVSAMLLCDIWCMLYNLLELKENGNNNRDNREDKSQNI